jgi:signal transduction histidine kinase
LWIGVFTALSTVALFYGHGWPTAVPFVLMYAAAYIFVGSYALVVIQAETARHESQTLLAELQTAHRQLQRYADQVKTLTVIEERQRLARDLHDSVTHTLFSINFTAEAARLLLRQNPAALETPLAQLQTLAQSALAELRALIVQFQPLTSADTGLASALRRHIATLKAHHALTVDLQIAAEPALSTEQGEQILRIVQEALHNVVKHAQTPRADLALVCVDGNLMVTIRDQGVGFTAEGVPITGQHFGLASMRARAAALGASVVIDSHPGAGTRITVTVPLSSTLPPTLPTILPKGKPGNEHDRTDYDSAGG